MVALICALASGGGFYFSLQLGALWWLAWVAPVPLLWLAFSGAPAARVALACWIAMAIGNANMLPAYWGVLPVLSLASALLLSGVGLAALVLGSTFVARRLSPLAGVVAFAALYTSVDYLMSLGPDGTAGSWANSQVGMPLLVQSASVFGLWAVDFVLTFFAAGIAMTLATGARTPALVALALFSINLGYGAVRLARVPQAPVIRVAAGAYDRAFRSAEPALEAYEQAVGQLVRAHPALIVFPEKIVPLDTQTRPLAVARLRAAASRAGALIVMGFDDESTKPPHNTALIALPGGAVLAYDKRHLVPGLETRFAPGHRGVVLGDGTGVAICKDLDFPATLRAEAARLHPNVMAVPAWDFEADGWWHARLAILRGVENGFAVVRSARNGLLSISDAYGRVLARRRSGAHPMALLTGTVPRGPGATIYTRIGDVFPRSALLLAGALLVLALWRGQRLAPGTHSTSPLEP